MENVGTCEWHVRTVHSVCADCWKLTPQDLYIVPPCFTLFSLNTVAVHPQFAENRWVYLYYTYNRGNPNCPVDLTDGPFNLCTRYVMNEDWTLDMTSELVLFQSTPLPDKIHNGGE